MSFTVHSLYVVGFGITIHTYTRIVLFRRMLSWCTCSVGMLNRKCHFFMFGINYNELHLKLHNFNRWNLHVKSVCGVIVEIMIIFLSNWPIAERNWYIYIFFTWLFFSEICLYSRANLMHTYQLIRRTFLCIQLTVSEWIVFYNSTM